jgi:hypothetical protein
MKWYLKDGTTEVASPKAPGAYYAVYCGKIRTHILGDGAPEMFEKGKWVLKNGNPAPTPPA